MTLRLPPLLALLLAACSTPPPRTGAAIASESRSARVVSSGTPLERFLPLVHGHIQQYEFESDGHRGMLPVTVQRTDERHGAWLLPQGGNAFEYRDDGVVTLDEQGASHVLQAPLAIGQRWRGGHQTWIEVRRVEVTIDVPAGSFKGCVETSETRGGDVPLSIVATFCPDVGMVQRLVTSGSKHERLVLKSYGPPVDLGPDGVRILKDD